MFKVIIAGGRDFNDRLYLNKVLDHLLSQRQEVTILCGMARGADTLGQHYAIQKGIPVEEYPAQWNKYGKSAGYRRNAVMANNADALIAFWDGKSKGTMHMINLAKEAGLDVRVKSYG